VRVCGPRRDEQRDPAPAVHRARRLLQDSRDPSACLGPPFGHTRRSERVVANGYDQMGEEFSIWNSERPAEVRRWFPGEILVRLGRGSTVLELGCGPGTDAAALSAGRRYVGVDLSRVQLSIARRRVPHATFLLGDFTSMAFRKASFDAVVAFYVFMHVPQEQLVPTFERILGWLRPGVG
jgi:ubiquinone/menaquinone biosynthesis C-methylase UbiE